MYLLLRDTGLRIGQALRLRLEDVRLEDSTPTIAIAPFKRAKARTVPILSERLAGALKLRLRTSRPHAEGGWIFPGRRFRGQLAPRPWTPHGARKAWHAWARAAGLLGPAGTIVPHRLRHTLATELGQDRRVGLWTLMSMMGWSKPESARRYVEPAEARAAIGPLGR